MNFDPTAFCDRTIQVKHSQVRTRQDHGAADGAAGCAGAVPGGAAQGGQGGPAQEEEGEEAGRRALAAPRWQEGHHHCPGQDNREGFQG